MFPNGAGRGLWMSPGWSRPLKAPAVTASGITISRPFHNIHTVKKKQTEEKAKVVAADTFECCTTEEKSFGRTSILGGWWIGVM